MAVNYNAAFGDNFATTWTPFEPGRHRQPAERAGRDPARPPRGALAVRQGRRRDRTVRCGRDRRCVERVAADQGAGRRRHARRLRAGRGAVRRVCVGADRRLLHHQRAHRHGGRRPGLYDRDAGQALEHGDVADAGVGRGVDRRQFVRLDCRHGCLRHSAAHGELKRKAGRQASRQPVVPVRRPRIGASRPPRTGFAARPGPITTAPSSGQ